MYLVDTNVVSEARRGSAEASAWLRSIDPRGVHLSVITLGEIMRGITLRRRKDPKAADHLNEWLHMLRQKHADRVLPISERIAIEWGRLAALRPRGDADGLIAATALVHDLILVTRNVADFADAGIPIIDPWERG